jgi:hypothetical protein
MSGTMTVKVERIREFLDHLDTIEAMCIEAGGDRFRTATVSVAIGGVGITADYTRGEDWRLAFSFPEKDTP